MENVEFDPGLQYYVTAVVDAIAGKKRFLPFNIATTRHISLGLEGIELPEDVSEMSLNQGVRVLAKSLKEIYRVYGRTYVFAHPKLYYIPGRKCLLLKVGMLEKTKWKEFQKKRTDK